jgi:TetR/AcrR family transcriptional repressor of lmrAB and yxaGH operons
MAAARERMISTTARLLQAQGYAATGLNRITAEATAPKGSMYHHFPGGKEELAAVAIATSAAVVSATLEDCLSRHDHAGDGLEAFIELLITQLEASNFTNGCPVATTALETAATSDRLAETTDEAFTSWTNAIAARLDGTDTTARATTIVAAIEGALILAKAKRSIEPLREVQRTIPKLLA